MTALLAMIVGILAVGYAAWPLGRGAATSPLTDGPHPGGAEVESEAEALLAWARAAGETQSEAEVAGHPDHS